MGLAGLFLGFTLDYVVVFIHINLKIRYESQNEFDEFVHATLTPLFQLEKSL